MACRLSFCLELRHPTWTLIGDQAALIQVAAYSLGKQHRMVDVTEVGLQEAAGSSLPISPALASALIWRNDGKTEGCVLALSFSMQL